ncbi:MAG: LCP family protein, partial [Gemmiger sp.]
MSEPRNPSAAGSEDRIALEQQYEEARRRAQQQTAIQGGRRSRRIQTNTVHPIGAKDPASFAAQAQAAIEAKAAASEPAPEPVPEKPLTRAQQQAMALRRAAAQRQAQATVRPQPAPSRPAAPAPAESRPQPAAPVESRPQPDEAPVSKSAAAVSAALSAPGARPRQGRTVQRTVRRSEPAPQTSAQPPRPEPPVQPPRPEPPVQPSRPEPPVQPSQPAAPRSPRPENRPPESPSADAAKAARLLEEMESHPKAPRKKAAPAAGTKSSGNKSSANGGKKKKKKGGWWKILLATLLVLALIVFGTFALIMQALKPETGGNITLSQLLNTPREYADKEFNVLLVGIDRSTENAAAGDGQVNDGLTDMIMWLHFNNETGEVKMLQIPRNILVTSDWNYSNNYQINAIAKSNGEAGKNDLNALCTYVANAFQVSIDGYITVRLEKLVDLVDIIGGVQVYVPMEMTYNGSHLDAGYQNMDGAACEFFLRTRHIYADSDLGRLNMQRYFYAAMFAKLRSMSMWDIAKNLPFYLSMVDTSLDA